MEIMETAEEQPEKQTPGAHLEQWRFQPGISGNPGGRPKGAKSLKTYAREYLMSLSDEEKMEYMAAMDKKVIWEMAEGKPKQDVEMSGEMISKVVSVDE